MPESAAPEMTSLRNARVLVTGSSGFVGQHLVTALRFEGAEVFGIDRGHRDRSARSKGGCLTRFVGDIRDPAFLTEVLKEARPSHIFHLASTLHRASEGLTILYDTNIMGTVHLLEAVMAAKLNPVIMISSSSSVYGINSAEESPVRENQTLRPVTHYGVSKAAQEMVALKYHRVHSLHMVFARTFNLIGPGQPTTLLASDVARQIALAERHRNPAIVRVGSLSARRDFLDVRDAVLAYLLLATHGLSGEAYNVCSGKSRSVKEAVDFLICIARVPLLLEIEETRIRHMDVVEQEGDSRRLREATGWRAKISLERSLQDLLNYWRAECSGDEAA